jgi:hypothetical protein
MKVKFLLLVSLLIYGCTSYQYIPSPHFVPLNENKGELKGGLSVFSLQGGYSFSNHLSVFASGYYKPEALSNLHISFFDYKMRSEISYNADLGLSFFANTKYFNYEVLLGSEIGYVCYSNTYNWADKYEFVLNAGKYNLFVQPDIGKKLNKNLEMGLVSRFSRVIYYGIRTSLNDSEIYPLEPADEYFMGKRETDFLFAEPGLFFKGGWKYIKFSAVITLNYIFEGIDINYRRGSIFGSAFISFDLLRKKQDE